MSVYLDASVLVPRLVEESESATVDAYLAASSEELLISDFAAAEVASALSRLVCMRRLGTAEASATLVDFEIWRAARSSPVELRAADARLAYAYLRRFDLMLRAPDAMHLAMTSRLNTALVTLDRRLEAAAQQLGIAVQVPQTK